MKKQVKRHLRTELEYFFIGTLILGTLYGTFGTKLSYMLAGIITAIISWKVLKKYA